MPNLDSENKQINQRIDEYLSVMTLEEKIAQIGSVWSYELITEGAVDPGKCEERISHGVGHVTRIGGASDADAAAFAERANEIQQYLVNKTRLGIPAVVHEECCSGLMTRGATLFPQAIGLAATWDPETVHDVGDTIRRQMRRIGAHHALSPVLDVARDPRWGRTEETFGEDPYLVGRLGSAYVQGIQSPDLSDGVIATAKHFVGYGAGEGGMNWAPAHIPERELREVYLFPFEAAIRTSDLQSVMNAYGELDGIPCIVDRKLLTQILREEWGFTGSVVSDYFAIEMLRVYHEYSRSKSEAAAEALAAGIDIELPTTDCYGDPLSEQVRAGTVDEQLVDRSVRRILRQKFLLGLFDRPYVEPVGDVRVFDTAGDRMRAYDAARKSVVLLKNEDNLLPLAPEGADRPRKIAVIGPNGDDWRTMVGDYAYPCHIEALQGMGDAFGTALPDIKPGLDANFVKMVTVADGLRTAFGPEVSVRSARGCDVLDPDESGFDEAVELAAASDVVICAMGDRSGLIDGCTSGEARDRVDLHLPGVQEDLLRLVVATGTPTILLLFCARPTEISWASENVPAIAVVWMPGEEGGNAIADVLAGRAEPGGKLPICFPRHVGQVPIFHGHKPSGGRSHWLGTYVEMGTDPLYPFGFGLTYAATRVTGLSVDKPRVSSGDRVRITCRVSNLSERNAEEVVQLYTRQRYASVTRPVRELKGFRRVQMEPSGTVSVSFELSVSQLAFYGMDGRFCVEPGEVEVMVGRSSAEIDARCVLEIAGERVEIAAAERAYFSSATVTSTGDTP